MSLFHVIYYVIIIAMIIMYIYNVPVDDLVITIIVIVCILTNLRPALRINRSHPVTVFLIPQPCVATDPQPCVTRPCVTTDPQPCVSTDPSK